MRTKTIKLRSYLELIARDRDFKDFALLFSTGTAIGGALVTIFIKNHIATATQVQDLSDNFDKKLQQLSNTSPDRSLDS
jgi:hypothetical protein